MIRIKWYLQTKQAENRVNLHHNSDRDEESHIESKKYYKQLLRLELNDIYNLNK